VVPDTRRSCDAGIEAARSSPLDNVLDGADEDLRCVEHVLEAASGAPNSSDERWYQIWRQLYYARKRSDLTQRLARVQATLEFHANYQYVYPAALSS
jgi:hypothetical protein